MVEYIIIGICAGLLAGMFGIGGGIVIVPALILILGWTTPQASGTSLAALLLPAGMLALMQYKKAGMLNIKASALILCGIFFGSFLGANIALSLDNIIMKQIYGMFLIWVGWKFVQPLKLLKKTHKHAVEFKDANNYQFYTFLITGFVSGICAGMFGIGGGVVITTILIGLLKIEPKKAVAISLAALLLPSGFPGVYMYYQSGYVNIIAAVIIAIGIELGSAVTAKVAIKTNSAMFKRFYGIFVFIIGIYFIIQKYISNSL